MRPGPPPPAFPLDDSQAMLRLTTCLLLLASACAHAPSAASSAAPGPTSEPAAACTFPREPPPAALIDQHGTILDAYQREGGVWLERAPILINEDFDFTLAMGLEGGVGAGLAAVKRTENNAHKAAALNAIAAPPQLQQRLAELRCCGVHVYFVLWGAESATLRTVLDVPGDTARSRVIEGATRSLAGEAGWTAPDVFAAEAQRALTDVACPAGPRAP